jgi:SAM-dependent methyltransferase
MEKFKNISCCRLCKYPVLKTVMDFGLSPLANAYPTSKDTEEEVFPLTVVKCGNCGHVQLKETIEPEVLFSNYLYSSSDSPSLINHFKDYASQIVQRFKPQSVLEIGSNDGILLRPLKELGVPRLIGVEPAANIADKSRDIEDKVNDSVAIYATYFTDPFAGILESKFGQVDIVCANNVFAHIAGLDDVIRGVSRILKGDGVFIFENAYLFDTIKGLYFDQVYHEHLQYYGIKPLANYLSIHGMEIFDIQNVGTQGGSFRVFVQKEGGKRPTTQAVKNIINEEIGYELYEDETYRKFLAKLSGLKSNLRTLIEKAQQENKTISCYGCPAKFALFSKYFELDDKIIKYVVDDSPLKQGRFSPGKKIPIVSREHFINNPTDYCIVSVWNMADAVIKRNPQYKGNFIIPMPEVKIV